MRIAIDLTPIYDHLTGVERYNINISKELINAHPDNTFVLLFKNEVHNSFENEVKQNNVETIIIPECNKLFFIQWRLYKVLKRIKADFYLFLSFTSPVLFRKHRIINAIHDLTCWDCAESIPTKMKLYYRFTYKVAAKRSWKIVTVSNFSQKQICERYGLPKNKVEVVYDGLTDIFREKPYENENLKNKYRLPDKYILSLSTIEPRKNLQLLIKAYKELIEEDIQLPDLVLAGRKGWKLDKIMDNIDNEVIKKIHFTGFIDDDDIAQIYREAELFVFPSKYEGFGLPVIEAMSQGTIVVCSDAASLPEVAGDAGILFKSNSCDFLKKALVRWLEMSEEEKDELIKKGIIVSKKYCWEKEANKLYNLLMK